MSKMNKKRRIDFKNFSVRISVLAIIIIIATLVSILKPITLYIDLTIIMITAFICIYISIMEIKEKNIELMKCQKV